MKTLNGAAGPRQKTLRNHVLQTVEKIVRLTGPGLSEEWLASDLTVTQLRFLLAMHAGGPLRMGDIAARLNVTLPSASNVIDTLVHKNLVVRKASLHDRRLVICRLSPAGESSINRLWGAGRAIIARLLESLTEEQMQKTAEVAVMLYEKARRF